MCQSIKCQRQVGSGGSWKENFDLRNLQMKRSLNGAQWWKFQKHVFSSPFWDQTFPLTKGVTSLPMIYTIQNRNQSEDTSAIGCRWTVPWQDIRKMNANALGNGLTLVHLGTRICNDCVGSLSHISFLRVFTSLKTKGWNLKQAKSIEKGRSSWKIILWVSYYFFGECNPGPLCMGLIFLKSIWKGRFFSFTQDVRAMDRLRHLLHCFALDLRSRLRCSPKETGTTTSSRWGWGVSTPASVFDWW